MVCLSRKDDRDKIDAIVIRVYGLYTDLFNIFSRETEFVGMQVSCDWFHCLFIDLFIYHFIIHSSLSFIYLLFII